jgi:hypothetical protein
VYIHTTAHRLGRLSPQQAGDFRSNQVGSVSNFRIKYSTNFTDDNFAERDIAMHAAL